VPSRSSKEARLGRYPNRNKKPDLGRTKSEIGFGKSQKAAGNAVSATNLGKSSSSSPKPPKAPRARRNPLATPEVGKALDNLRKRYTPPSRTRSEQDLKDNMSLQTERNASERKLEDAALRDFPTRPEALAAEPKIRQNTSLNAEGTTVERYRGRKPVGTPRVGETTRAARDGKLRRDGKKFTTPEVRQTRRKVRRAKREVRRARAQARSGVEGPLTPGQKKFVQQFSKRTGINPRVAGAWVLAEMSGSYATGREAEGNHNWLNIAYFDSGPGAITKDAVWGSPESAAKASADFLKGKRFGASQGIQNILPQARGASDETQIQAIAGSGWASSGYEGGNSLRGTRDLISYKPPSPGAKRRLERAKARANRVSGKAESLGLQGVRGEAPNKIAKEGKPRFVNYSQDGAGTSSTEWLVPTGGNEVLKFQRPLAEAMIALAKASGEPIQVNSGYRSNEEQADLYAAYLNGTGNLAAPPGQSNHNHGAAVDVNLTARQRELAPQFGLGFPVSGEDWHMELVGDAASNIVSTGGGGSYPSSGGGLSSGSTTTSGGAAPASGPTKRKTRQQRIIQQLRSLGYRVDSKGIKKIDNAPEEAEETLSEMRKRYGIK
jgi:hypothetical protein